jgi:hypothetical protein
MLNPSNSSNLSNLPLSFSAARGTFRSAHPGKLTFFALILAGGCFGGFLAADAQAQAAAPGAFAIGDLRAPLANVQTAIGNVSIGRWKASADVRATAQQDVSSMQRDLITVLPGLLTQAESASANGAAALSPAFAVFRNLDALYDVLLRVTETAALTAPPADANNLESARAGLENGRAKLGAWLLQAIGAQDARIAQAAAPAPRPAAAPTTPSKIVVDDGPENPKPRKKKPPVTPAPQ